MRDLESSMKPILQWPGGKSSVAQEIIDMIPTDFNRYMEPFVGGGARSGYR